jgi:hypothetical protein
VDKECSKNGEKWNAYRILVGKPEGKRPLGRLRSRWADNIKMDLREIGWYGIDWIDMAQDRDQWRVLVSRDYWEDQGVSGRTIIKWILER